MPNAIAVQAVTPLRAASDSSSDTKAVAFEQPAQPEHEAPASPIPNPSLQLDPALGLVVIEFRNDSGVITTSIPSERQMAAYQRWEQTKFGPVPSGLHEPTVTVAPQPAHQEPVAKPAPKPVTHVATATPKPHGTALK